MDSTKASTSQESADTNGELCVICQEETAEALTSTLHSERKDVGKGYQSLAENLIRFDALGKLPRTLQLDTIDEGQGNLKLLCMCMSCKTVENLMFICSQVLKHSASN